MKKTPTNGNYRTAADSQEPGADKEGITYESALREEGIDEVFVARKLKALLRAQACRWNPKKGSWEKFEDYGTQLAALREIAKILDIYPRQAARKDSENENKVLIIDMSAIPKKRREPVQTDSEHFERNSRA